MPDQPAAAAATTTAGGDGLSKTLVGRAAYFSIYASDASGARATRGVVPSSSVIRHVVTARPDHLMAHPGQLPGRAPSESTLLGREGPRAFVPIRDFHSHIRFGYGYQGRRRIGL